MPRTFSSRALYTALTGVGFPIPDNCHDISVSWDVSGAVQIVYHCHLNTEAAGKLGIALQGIAAAAQRDQS